MPGIATPSIVPLGIAWGWGTAEAAGAAATGGVNDAPPSMVFWKPGFAGAGACEGAGAGACPGAGALAEAGPDPDACPPGITIAGANPSMVFMGSLDAAGAGAAAAAGDATAGAGDTETGAARGVGSVPRPPGAKPSIVLSGTLLAPPMPPTPPTPEAGAGCG